MGPTVGEKVALLAAERASLQARADGEARIGLLPAFRAASLLTDALAARSEAGAERAFDGLPPFRRQAFAEIDVLNGALRDALERPSADARLAALKAAERATAELDRLAGLDDAPVILSFTPRFVPPRRPPDGTGSRDQDPPVQIEVVGPRLAPSRRPAARARGRRVARPGRRRPGAAALCRAALGLRHRPETHPLRDRHAVGARLRAKRNVPAPVHRAARQSRSVRLRSAGANDDARVEHAGVAGNPGAGAGRRDAHGAPLLRSAARLAFRSGAPARGHRRAAGLARRPRRSDA